VLSCNFSQRGSIGDALEIGTSGTSGQRLRFLRRWNVFVLHYER